MFLEINGDVAEGEFPRCRAALAASADGMDAGQELALAERFDAT